MAKKNRQDGEPIIIKKYANRRLYNTDSSCYVTLDDLAEMVKKNTDFVVKDAKSGENITHSVLTQIIFEEESKGETLLPTKFLRQLIAFYGDGLQQVVPGYLESSMAAFAENQEKFREFFKGNADKGGIPTQPTQPMQPFEEMAKQNMAIFEKTMAMFSPFAASGTGNNDPETENSAAAQKTPDDVPSGQQAEAGQSTKQSPSSGADNNQLSELQAQLAAMQDQINNLQKK
ncbi:MAG: polyhydroxyalkanoate synthesis repressor PhaR [Emcibacter sp.]|nr:polyhydroxyalkanoate synthesis repressor PhaR [Emcibacter sp.]